MIRLAEVEYYSMSDTSYSCLNCGSNQPDSQLYCHNCGQKNRSSRLTVSTLLSDFFSNLLNIDSKILQTIANVWRPAFLAKAYTAGERTKYLNPFRFFLVAFVVYIAIVANIMKSIEIPSIYVSQERIAHKSELLVQFDSLERKYIEEKHKPAADLFRHYMFKDVKYPEKDTMNDFGKVGFMDLGQYNITRQDFLHMNSDKIADKYSITDYWHKLAIGQMQKIYKSPEGSINSAIHNLIWVFILNIIFGALILKLLYIRNKIYYVEHFVLLLFALSVAFWLSSLGFLPHFFDQDFGLTSGIAFGVGLLYFFLSFLFYYRQGFFKTLVKFLIFSALYLFMTIVFVSLTFFVSLFIV